MKKGLIWVLVIIGLIVIFVGWGISSYNNLISLNEQVNNSWSQVETQLQRRADLIPNLVQTVKGYASHEQAAIKAVADARAKLAGSATTSQRMANENELTGALNRLLVVVENYPNLKADANFRQLMDNLEGTENRIAIARKDYNDNITVYNKKVQSFPTMIFANMLGFEKKAYFEAAPGTETAPKVNFE